MQTNPIGIFDSGIGGTSIWKEIHSLLPYENTIYLADSSNAPYGIKGVGEIGLVPTAGAVAAALFDYDGLWRTKLPMRPATGDDD